MTSTETPFDPSRVTYVRCTVDLATGRTRIERRACRNLEDVLGGVGRSFQLLAERTITDAYCPENPLVVNIGLLTGTGVMTGLRTYFSGYSPIKHSDAGAAGGHVGRGQRQVRRQASSGPGLDELVFEDRSETGRCTRWSQQSPEGPLKCELRTQPGHLLGLDTHRKIMALRLAHPGAHCAVIGPGGEQWQVVSAWAPWP